MFKKTTALALIFTFSQAPLNAMTSQHYPQGVEQSVIINAVFSMGASNKLTLLLVTNTQSLKPKDKEGLYWMLENIKLRQPNFWYCEHEVGTPSACKCMNQIKNDIAYLELSSFQALTDLCGKAGAPTLFIFKNGQILHKITRDVLLSNKLLAHEKEHMIIETITNVYKKALASSDF